MAEHVENTIKPCISFKNMKILAPMVRIGTLPMRLLALKYGADLVYCEEIIDHRFTRSTRKENVVLGSIDYVHPDGNIIFRTCEEEKDKVVFQMGTADPQRALQAAKMVENDVTAIDVNMGCPKDYSVKGGMGAALLKNPENVKNILTTLVQGISKPVTCKIRILSTLEETLDLVKIIEKTGVSAIAVHGREQHERPQHAVHKDVICEVSRALSIPVISNGGSGEIKTYHDMVKYQHDTETDSVMVARAAQWNPSIFRKEGPLSLETMIKDYIKFAVKYDNSFSNTKYCLCQLMREVLESEKGYKLRSAKTMKEICDIWELGDFLKECEDARRLKDPLLDKERGASRKRKMDEVNQLDLSYNRKLYGEFTPKCVLLAYTRKHALKLPVYKSIENSERVFKSTVTVDGETYASTIGDKSKKSAEQQAAMVCLKYLGLDDGKIRI